MKRFKKDYGTVRKIFPSTPRLFHIGNKYVDMATGKDDLVQVINNL